MSRFCLPRDIYHGKGSLEELKNLKGKKAILVVGGGSMKRQGFLDKAVNYLKEAGIETKLIENLHTQLLQASHLPERPFKFEMLRSLMQAAAYQMAMIVSSYMEVRPLDNNRDFNLYFRFTQAVAQNYRQSRRVDFYADKLCVTPKYLSASVKAVSGKTANRWIDEYVTVEARNLLRVSTHSVRQVSDYLNFPDASFFTKFFKKNTGLTPREFREKMRQQ